MAVAWPCQTLFNIIQALDEFRRWAYVVASKLPAGPIRNALTPESKYLHALQLNRFDVATHTSLKLIRLNERLLDSGDPHTEEYSHLRVTDGGLHRV